MQKTMLFALIGILSITSANAGLFDVFTKKETTPTTLAEACNKDEIATVCPETVLGDKTIVECLTENVTKLSKKCATYIKTAATEKVAELTGGATDKAADAKTTADTKTAEVKATADTVSDTAKSLKNLF